MEGDFIHKQSPEEGGAPVPLVSPKEVYLQLPGYQEDFAEIYVNIKETRICRNRILTAAIILFALGMASIVALVIFSELHFTSANVVGLILNDAIGAISGLLTTGVGGALFKYYQSLQRDLQKMWDNLNKRKQDQGKLKQVLDLLRIMKDGKKKDELIAEAVRSIVKSITTHE